MLTKQGKRRPFLWALTSSPSYPGPLPAKILIILTPPGYEGYWEEMAQHLATGSPPDPALVLSLQQKYHLETGGQVRQFSLPGPEQAS